MLENLISPTNIIASMTSALPHPKQPAVPSSAKPQGQTHYTIYTCPYLFYPRRIHSYLTLKPLPSHVKLSLVPTAFDTHGQMTTPAGKIDGSIPMMRVDAREGGEMWIRQSVAILGYFEEAHPRSGAEGVEADMCGSTPLRRARVNEIVSLVEEASQAFGFMAMHSSSLYTPLVVGGQSHSAFQTARQRLDKSLATLESYARHAVLEERRWIAGTEGLTIADLCLGSLVEYARDMYGWDLREGHEVVGRWVERWEETEAGRRGGEKMPPVEMTGLAKRRVWEE